MVSEDVAELSGMLGRQGSLSPNSIILQGESPLHVSVRKDRIHSTKVLLDQGADVNLQVSLRLFILSYRPYQPLKVLRMRTNSGCNS